jgi:hypothetical protein
MGDKGRPRIFVSPFASQVNARRNKNTIDIIGPSTLILAVYHLGRKMWWFSVAFYAAEL